MGIYVEALINKLDIATRLRDERRGEQVFVCYECLTPQLDHTNDITHKPRFWPIDQVLAEVTKEIDIRRCLESGVI